MTPEQTARQQIDRQLQQAGWIVQDYRQMNISAGLGVAVREFPLSSGAADYVPGKRHMRKPTSSSEGHWPAYPQRHPGPPRQGEPRYLLA
jgi:hypothetical protein